MSAKSKKIILGTTSKNKYLEAATSWKIPTKNNTIFIKKKHTHPHDNVIA